jgi:hypothetical protein
MEGQLNVKDDEQVMLIFGMVAKKVPTAAHTSFRCEGHINIGLEEHMKTCRECRDAIVKDLKEFALQLELASSL